MFEILDFPRKGTCNYYFLVADMGELVDVSLMDSAAQALIKEFDAALSWPEYANLVNLRSGSHYKICTSSIGNASYCKMVLVDTDRMGEEKADSVISPLIVRSDLYVHRLHFGRGEHSDIKRFMSDDWDGFLSEIDNFEFLTG